MVRLYQIMFKLIILSQIGADRFQKLILSAISSGITFFRARLVTISKSLKLVYHLFIYSVNWNQLLWLWAIHCTSWRQIHPIFWVKISCPVTNSEITNPELPWNFSDVLIVISYLQTKIRRLQFDTMRFSKVSISCQSYSR